MNNKEVIDTVFNDIDKRLNRLEKKYNKVMKTIQHKIETHYHAEINRKIIEFRTEIFNWKGRYPWGVFWDTQAENSKRIEIMEKNIKIVNKDHQKVVIDINKLQNPFGEEGLTSRGSHSKLWERGNKQQGQIAELREQYKALMMEWSGSENDRMEIWEQIVELQENLKLHWETIMGIRGYKLQINALKEEIKSLYANETRDLDQMLNIQEVLQDIINNDDALYLSKKEIERLLEKLDSKEKVEKKEMIPSELKPLYHNHHYSQFKKDSGGWRDCNKCELYGECDHQGAYKKDGKWCYEDWESERDYVKDYEYGEDCPECGFNQKDNDEREQININKLKEEFLEDLRNYNDKILEFEALYVKWQGRVK